MKILISRIKGGLGNQLYCYAAAKRLALKNNAELVIDNVSGFLRDKEYQRQYSLDAFDIKDRYASAWERLEPFERIRRGVWKIKERKNPFELRSYIEQEINDFDHRLLNIKLNHSVTYIDGLWQSQAYFADIEDVLRKELVIKSPIDEKNLSISNLLKQQKTVAIHVRWFQQQSHSTTANVSQCYYKKAIAETEERLDKPFYAVFSDRMDYTKKTIEFPLDRTIFIDHNQNKQGELADFWLMTQCHHFIIANSTFSWWAAWIGGSKENSQVYFPRLTQLNSSWMWDYQGQMPQSWQPLFV
ncbi:alpha-1,2-fucosyltransferase [Thiothrix unzii]|jgi:hypothetical protein|uniref:alpha-1,2-fucosyltransferase n=1 Tax=Thiothrix unzii TaxID=111769 RepID=UPI002A3634AC|nr:alpha-1,2-fucosyltransferase [Thiothrix unzii]MDX9988227.1 alpha-1,2-fucosyltransferase [Thiothrix unzii]